MACIILTKKWPLSTLRNIIVSLGDGKFFFIKVCAQEEKEIEFGE